MNKVQKNGLVQMVQKFLIQNKTAILYCCVMMVLMMTGVASAAEGDRADQLWGVVSTLLEKWVMRFGGVVMFVGIITFGVGYHQQDAGQKINGMNTIIGGAIVCAGAAAVSTFFF